MSYRIPKNVKDEARIGVKLKELGFAGALETGINRGYQLAGDRTIGVEDLRVMRAWFARHGPRGGTSYPGYVKWIRDGMPMDPKFKNKYRGAVAYLLWGGESARKWIDGLELD